MRESDFRQQIRPRLDTLIRRIERLDAKEMDEKKTSLRAENLDYAGLISRRSPCSHPTAENPAHAVAVMIHNYPADRQPLGFR